MAVEVESLTWKGPKGPTPFPDSWGGLVKHSVDGGVNKSLSDSCFPVPVQQLQIYDLILMNSYIILLVCRLHSTLLNISELCKSLMVMKF